MNRWAIPKPMPWVPPVMAATLPSKRFDTSRASISTAGSQKGTPIRVTLGCCGSVSGAEKKEPAGAPPISAKIRNQFVVFASDGVRSGLRRFFLCFGSADCKGVTGALFVSADSAGVRGRVKENGGGDLGRKEATLGVSVRVANNGPMPASVRKSG